MPRLVVNPRSRYGFEANFNPSLRMSNGAISSIMFKIDQEKARYERTIKLLNWHEKLEARMAQKQVEEAKKELVLMRAYQQVAKQTAFKKFDPVIRRRREQREKRRFEEEEQALEKEKEEGDDDEHGDLSRNKKLVLEENRRLSMTGNVFLTFRDIVGNDDVLKRNSQEINEMRRKSSNSLESDYGAESLTPRRRNNKEGQRRSRRESLASVESNDCGDAVINDNASIEEINDDGFRGNNSLDVGKVYYQRRRKSRAGSFGVAELDSIQESIPETGKENDLEQNNERHDDQKESANSNFDSSVGNKSGSIVVHGRKSFRMGSFLKGVFLTENDDVEGKEDQPRSNPESHVGNEHREKPLTIYQISDLYNKQKSDLLEETKNKELTHQKKMEQIKYEEIRRRLQQEKTVKENGKLSNLKKACNAPEKKSDDSSSSTDDVKLSKEENCPANLNPHAQSIPTLVEPSEETEPSLPLAESLCKRGAPLKGIARFKNAAAAVSVQINLNKGAKTNRLKTLAAAVVMKKNTTAGRVPKAFMLSHEYMSRSPRNLSKATPLEASHRKPEDCKIRPLAMPQGVKADYENKWKELMGNINGAVHWKVRALREDTGTLNTRQLRRQVAARESDRSPRAVFPGSCKTTWAMKKYVNNEINDVVKAWQPDNVRKTRNRTMKAKISLPDFVDRIRTTTSILQNFRDYRQQKEGNDSDNNNDDNDDEEENVLDDSDDDEASSSRG